VDLKLIALIAVVVVAVLFLLKKVAPRIPGLSAVASVVA